MDVKFHKFHNDETQQFTLLTKSPANVKQNNKYKNKNN